LIAPSSTNGVATDAWEQVTGFVVRAMLPEVSPGTYFAPQDVRESISKARRRPRVLAVAHCANPQHQSATQPVLHALPEPGHSSELFDAGVVGTFVETQCECPLFARRGWPGRTEADIADREGEDRNWIEFGLSQPSAGIESASASSLPLPVRRYSRGPFRTTSSLHPPGSQGWRRKDHAVRPARRHGGQ
jgi:hypothetical protein